MASQSSPTESASIIPSLLRSASASKARASCASSAPILWAVARNRRAVSESRSIVRVILSSLDSYCTAVRELIQSSSQVLPVVHETPNAVGEEGQTDPVG